jgi:hypothetical protein
LKHSFVEAGACRCTTLINFSNNSKYGGTTRRPAPIMMQSHLLVVSASVSTFCGLTIVNQQRLHAVAERFQFGALGLNSGANLCRRELGHWRLVNYDRGSQNEGPR